MLRCSISSYTCSVAPCLAMAYIAPESMLHDAVVPPPMMRVYFGCRTRQAGRILIIATMSLRHGATIKVALALFLRSTNSWVLMRVSIRWEGAICRWDLDFTA